MPTPVGPVPPDPNDPDLWEEWDGDPWADQQARPIGLRRPWVRVAAAVFALAFALYIVIR